MPAVGQRGRCRVKISQQLGKDVCRPPMPAQGDLSIGQLAIADHQLRAKIGRHVPEIGRSAAAQTSPLGATSICCPKFSPVLLWNVPSDAPASV